MKIFQCDNSEPKKRNWFGSIGLILLSIALTSCSPAESQKIIIRGSNTIGEELAPRLITEYQKENPGLTFDIEFKGTSYGLGALMVERCDIAAASRDFTSNELELARDRDIAFNNYAIGSYSVAVIVNERSALANLSLDQVGDIFTGTIQNWNEVGGPDAPVHLYIRDAISGTHLGFQELAMEKKPYALHLKTFTNNTGIIEAVAKDANGIGYASIDLPKNAGIKAVAIEGVAPTIASINKREYPYARVLRLHTTKKKESAAARDFIKFVQSPRGQAIVKEMGYAPQP